MLKTLYCRYFQRAFFWSVPIGGLAGLIGLGGGEFRLPVLTHIIGFPPRAAIPLNLLISLVTLSFALVARNHAIPVSGVLAHYRHFFHRCPQRIGSRQVIRVEATQRRR